MTTEPRSIRFEAAVLARLRNYTCHEAGSGGNISAVAHRFIDEGLRMAEHPGIVFKSGPSGRRAALMNGPDVWEIVKFLREVDERHSAALVAAAEVFNLDVSRISVATAYYGDYTEEIDAQIEDADQASERAERAWLAQQKLIGLPT
jgi:hypothetical protein